MAKRPHEELVEFTRETLDGKLRAVVLYERTGLEVLFARDDVDGRFVGTDGESQLRGTVPPAAGRDVASAATTPDEKLDCLVGITETAVVTVLYPTEDTRIRVSFERDHDLSLQPFVEDCLAIVR